MATRKTPASPKPDKLCRDALLLELQRDGTDKDGKKAKKLRLLMRRLVDKGIEGDVSAIKEINDRIDGRAHQSVGLSGDGDGPIVVKIIGTDSGLL